jgi:hypothetical protein
MIYGVITGVIFLLAFSYIVLVLANKESGNMKLAGQILAAFIVLVAIVVLYYGVSGRGGCPVMGGGMMGGGMMGGKGMMGGSGNYMIQMMKENPSMMDNMMKDKDFRQMMQKRMMKYGK